MEFTFSDAVRALRARDGDDFAFQIVNTARPPGDYLFNTFLPEIPTPGFRAEGGSMTVITTMAGLTGQDSPYAIGGMMRESTFSEKLAKLTISTKLSEAALIRLHELTLRMRANNQPTTDFITNNVLNFYQKVIVQALRDTREWLRGRALCKGVINWTYGQQTLNVDYGIPAANRLARKTGNNGCGGSTSTFWADYRQIRKVLRGGLNMVGVAHPEMIDMITYNGANQLQVLAQGDGRITFQKVVGTTERSSGDVRDTVTLIAYDREAEILNPDNPRETIKRSFMDKETILWVKRGTDDAGWTPGEGSTDDPANDLRLGYTHLGPTVEGRGALGDWGDLFTPQDEPWSLHARGAGYSLPVLENPKRVATQSSELV